MNTIKPHFIFATNNQHKLEEIQKVCSEVCIVEGLKESGIEIEIDEPYNTLEENAFIKCETIYNLTGKNCFSEDTGLEIEALHGEPGVRSARYAGEHKSDADNIQKVLEALKVEDRRNARFRTVICLCYNRNYTYFEGICNGTITMSPLGINGFGYDPIFIPENHSLTFAEMDNQLKINISHRKKAFNNLSIFLQNLV